MYLRSSAEGVFVAIPVSKLRELIDRGEVPTWALIAPRSWGNMSLIDPETEAVIGSIDCGEELAEVFLDAGEEE